MWVARKGTNLLNQVFAFDSDPAFPRTYEWKSKVFITQGLDNFAFGQLFGEFNQGLTAQEEEDLLALIASVKAYNAAIADSNGDLNEPQLNEVTMNGDSVLLDAPNANFSAGSVTFRYWGDGVLRLERSVNSQEPFPMPAGFRAEKHEISISGQVEIQQATIATSIEELAAI
jgi:hypothetical protein